MVKGKTPNYRKKQEPNEFWSAVKDIRKLTFDSLSAKEKRIENRDKSFNKKNAKMPIFMLKGIRNKALERHKQKQKEMEEGQILYDSSMQKQDLTWHKNKQNKRDKSKKHHEYNSYKYENSNKQGFGKYSNGVLKFSNNEIKKINKKH